MEVSVTVARERGNRKQLPVRRRLLLTLASMVYPSRSVRASLAVILGGSTSYEEDEGNGMFHSY